MTFRSTSPACTAAAYDNVTLPSMQREIQPCNYYSVEHAMTKHESAYVFTGETPERESRLEIAVSRGVAVLGPVPWDT